MVISLLRVFWGCGDNDIIELALKRARLNVNERNVITMILDECMTQEEIAERLDRSVRWVQKRSSDASNKLITIPWVYSYAKSLKDTQ